MSPSKQWMVVMIASVAVFGATSIAEAQSPVVVEQPAPTGVVIVQAQTPTYAPVQYGQPVYAQPAYAPQPRRRGGPNLGLIISGAVLLGVGWIANFLVGLPAGDDPFHSGAEPEWQTFRYTSFIPIAGPWVQLAVKPTGFDDDYWGMWLIIDGLMQAAGFTLLIAGIATSTSETEEVASAGGVELMLIPSAGPDHASLTLAGRF